jgi:Flp pilus assembly protein TadG
MRLLKNRKGNAAIETALLFPLLLLLGAGVGDFGFGVYDHMQLVSAVRAGAQYAVKAPDDAAGVQAAVEGALSADPSAVSITVSTACECPGGGAALCSDVCADGLTARKYVTVSAAQPRQWLIDYPLITKPDTLSAEAVMRVQ